MQHIVEKLSTRDIILLQTSFQSKVYTQSYGPPKSRESQLCEWHLGANPMGKHKVYYKGEGGGFPQVRAVMSLVSSTLPMACPSTKSVLVMH
jgi:hypothetical protein